jgi:hypothetical protein
VGEETGTSVVNPSHVVRSLSDLPICNSSNDGFLYYIDDISQFRYCSSGTYKNVNISGSSGSIGSISCIGNSFTLRTTSTGTLTLVMNYKVHQLGSGDVIATATVIGSDIGLSATEYYSYQQNGFSTAPVYLYLDLVGSNTGGYFKVGLNRTNLTIDLDYYDSSNSYYGLSDPQSFTLNASTKCINNSYTSIEGNNLSNE